MSIYGGPDIITSNLVLHLDAGNISSYPGSGNIWYDISGFQQHFTLFNILSSDINRFGINFAQSNSYARLRNSSILPLCSSAATIDICFRSLSNSLVRNNNGSTYSRLLSISNTAGTGSDSTSTLGTNNDFGSFFCLARDSVASIETFGLWYKNNPGGFFTNPKILFNTTRFFNIAIVYYQISSTMYFLYYVNGVLSGSTSSSATPFGSDASTITLCMNAYGSLLNLQEPANVGYSTFRMYNRVLSSNEILQNYNALKGRFGL
jgi:hypothetical protein